MKQGFTLIELLAIIVILSIIALITIPIVSDTIENSKRDSFKRSIEEMKNMVDMDYNENARSGTVTYQFQDNTLVCLKCDNNEDLELDFTGKVKNAKGTIVNNNGQITLTIENSKYKATNGSDDKVKIVKK